MKDTAICINCYREFADHNYVPNSIDQYKCPEPVRESYYGYFNGGDPRDFHPDAEDCTPEELANHKKACEEAEATEAGRNIPNPSGWIKYEGGMIHVLNAPFGIGVQTVEYESFFEELEERDEPA